MTIELIRLGSAPGDNTGDGIRAGGTKANNNFANATHAASKLVGTAAGEIPTNGDLGTASLGNTGTATGEIPTADDLDMVGAISNWSSNNLQTQTSFGLNVQITVWYDGASVVDGAYVSGANIRAWTMDSSGNLTAGGAAAGTWKNISGATVATSRLANFVRVS